MKRRFIGIAAVTLDVSCIIASAETNALWRHAVSSYVVKAKPISAVCAEVEQMSRRFDPSGRGLTIVMCGPDDALFTASLTNTTLESIVRSVAEIADKDLAIFDGTGIVLSSYGLPHRVTRLTTAIDALCTDSQTRMPLEIPLRCQTVSGGDVVCKPQGDGRYTVVVDYPIQTYQIGDHWYFRPSASEVSMSLSAEGYQTNHTVIGMMPFNSPSRPIVTIELEPIKK
jgi:hypothetical protein